MSTYNYILRSFHIQGRNPNSILSIHEDTTPDTVALQVSFEDSSTTIYLTQESFKALAGLSAYSTYGDSVRFVEEE